MVLVHSPPFESGHGSADSLTVRSPARIIDRSRELHPVLRPSSTPYERLQFTCPRRNAIASFAAEPSARLSERNPSRKPRHRRPLLRRQLRHGRLEREKLQPRPDGPAPLRFQVRSGVSKPGCTLTSGPVGCSKSGLFRSITDSEGGPLIGALRFGRNYPSGNLAPGHMRAPGTPLHRFQKAIQGV
jgi:hypothetical protein